MAYKIQMNKFIQQTFTLAIIFSLFMSLLPMQVLAMNFVPPTPAATNTVVSKDEVQNPEHIYNEACEIEGHKYNQAGVPLNGWSIGLMKIITHDNGVDVYDLDTRITNEDGYYCLEWDGETRVGREESTYVNDSSYSFVYRVYEKLVAGWENVSVEMGSDSSNLAVVADEDIVIAGDEVGVQIGENNGHIFANAAYHVDFYNQIIPGKDDDVVEEEATTTRSVGSSGTRVGGRSGSLSRPKATPTVAGTNSSNPAGQVLGEQVTVVPYGGAGAGAGGAANDYREVSTSSRLLVMLTDPQIFGSYQINN